MTLLQGHKDPVLPILIKVSNHMIMYNYATYSNNRHGDKKMTL